MRHIVPALRKTMQSDGKLDVRLAVASATQPPATMADKLRQFSPF